MPGDLRVELNPTRVQVDAGASSVDLVVSIQNLGDVVDQYIVEVDGLDADWFTQPPNLGLFPQDREQVRVNLHPPGRGVRKGSYPFKILVRSRGGAAAESADGVLEIRGAPKLNLELKPPRLIARGQGTFTLLMANSGNADVRANLEGRDAEEACDVRFPRDESPLVPAGGKA